LTIAKAIVGVIVGFAGDPVGGRHSLIDFVATVMTYFAVRISGKPADEEHHYGHGKVESVSALAENRVAFRAFRRGDLEAVRRLCCSAKVMRWKRRRGFRRDHRLGAGRFLPRPRAQQGAEQNLQRGAEGRRAAFQLRSCIRRSLCSPGSAACARPALGRFRRGDRGRALCLPRGMAARRRNIEDADRHGSRPAAAETISAGRDRPSWRRLASSGCARAR
jgi:hypothetical protein